MANRADITPELLRQLLRYEPETGKLFWLGRGPDLFVKPQYGKSWNSKFAGKEAMSYIGLHGYQVGDVFAVKMRKHRVCWAIYHGAWPDMDIDHINGNCTDNRIANLRCVTPLENMKNLKIGKHNTSGIMGVRWDKARNKWAAHIRSDGKPKNLGRFKTKEEAISARKKAEVTLGYHKNHGRN